MGLRRAQRFLQAIGHANAARSPRSRQQRIRDALYYGRNRCLRPLELLLQRRMATKQFPIVFIVGGPRTGSTLLHQLVAEYLDVGYVTNAMASYWSLPTIAGICHGRAGGGHGIELRSDHGRSYGAEGPHEWSWFWHEYFDFREHDDLSVAQLAQVDGRALCRDLESLCGWYGRPLVLKTPKFTAFQIDWLAETLPSSRFLWITRDRSRNVASILKARRREQGDPRLWWAARPRDYRAFLGRDPQTQIEHQVDSIRSAIETSFARLPRQRWLTAQYERLVTEPKTVLSQIAELCQTSVTRHNALDKLRLTPTSGVDMDHVGHA